MFSKPGGVRVIEVSGIPKIPPPPNSKRKQDDGSTYLVTLTAEEAKNHLGEKIVKRNSDNNKFDSGKLQIRHVPPQIIRDIAEIRMYGIEKYKDPENWKRVELDRYIDALLRHTLSFMEDTHSVDEESHKEHYKHMACNMAFICELMAKDKKQEGDI